MIKPDWNAFRAKFTDNPQSTFEWFCYLLFCCEFNKNKGIFRYINQAGIETNPITVDSSVIAWQAKFYDTSLSNHKADILDCLEKTNKYYQNVTTLHFYSNQEWGQYDGGKPNGLIEVEEKAKNLNITIDWRLSSFFETEFVIKDNKEISQHFFSNTNSAFDLVRELKLRSSIILKAIRSSIPFGNNEIKISRTYEIDKIKQDSTQVIIVAGSAGTGKTAVIKDYYEVVSKDIPFFIFKAQELCVSHINELFGGTNPTVIQDIFKNDSLKIIVIDSAERLLDISNREPSKLLFQVFKDNGWKIIFTSREVYLDNLISELADIYGICPKVIRTTPLTDDILSEIATTYNFQLPIDSKLKKLLRTPLYLGFYLKCYKDNLQLDYSSFKKSVWKKEIAKNPRRENLFIQIVKKRVQTGIFYVNPDNEHEIAEQLRIDEILGYDNGGYFITHDIYEEWGLEEIIKREHANSVNIFQFFKNIPSQLPVRRSFRQWVSDLLMKNDSEGMLFIHQIMTDSQIEEHWRDEVNIAVLLSEYSGNFFCEFKDKLLANDNALLKRITFLLRTSCKTINHKYHTMLGAPKVDLFQLSYVMTTPKGSGWNEIIRFVYDNLDQIGIVHIDFILPVLYDWNNEYHKSETTKFATLVAIKYYLNLLEGDWFTPDNILLKTITNGAYEVKNELKNIFEIVVSTWSEDQRNPHLKFVEFVLAEIDALHIAYALPSQVIKLAQLYWGEKPDASGYFGPGVDRFYGLIEHRSDDFPPSVYKTPILWLLRVSPIETIDFICDFTNNCIEEYSKSKLEEIFEIVLPVGNAKISQYASDSLWCLYRGTSSPVTPYLLQSIHMALERYLLTEQPEIEYVRTFLYMILTKSKSVSLTAVVASVVIAKPVDFFDIAKILFQVKEFFNFDFVRCFKEPQVELLIKPFGPGRMTNEPYDGERLESAKLKHRKNDLQNLFLNYQMFRMKPITEEEAKIRQKELWKIIDMYYSSLPPEDKQSPADLQWILTLSKMDRRKLTIETEVKDDGILFQFKPELPAKVTDYSKKANSEIETEMKHLPLKSWVQSKLDYKDISNGDKFDKDPLQTLKVVKEILKVMESDTAQNEKYYWFNSSIPVMLCSLLLRDYRELLSGEDFSFCVEILIEFTALVIGDNYHYQMGDGMHYAILNLPEILKRTTGERYFDKIKTILLFGLIRLDSLDLYQTQFNELPLSVIEALWKTNYSDMKSIVWGHHILHERYVNYWHKANRFDQNNKAVSSNEAFYTANTDLINQIIQKNIKYNDINSVKKTDLHVLLVCLKIVANHTTDDEIFHYLNEIITTFSKYLLNQERGDRLDHTITSSFFETYAKILLLSNDFKTIDNLLSPFINNFQKNEIFSDLFEDLIIAEDRLDCFGNFWYIWDKFKPLVIEHCNSNDHYSQDIVKHYLFATVPWNEGTQSWHSINETTRIFFIDVCSQITKNSGVIFAMSKLLSDIGMPLILDGIPLLSKLIEINPKLARHEKEHTIYYLEKDIRRYIHLEYENIKRSNYKKGIVITILNFLINEGSVVAFMLRESIL